jgi:muramidase (phage lysozyme)
MRGSGLLIMSAAIAAVLLFARRAEAAPENPTWNDPLPLPSWDDANLRAFLFLIRNAEHTRADALTGAAYQTFYGGARFNDLSDHPVLTGELRGVPLPDAVCRRAGFSPGCVSTAAGAYQIIAPTWRRVREAGDWGSRLLDFGPDSQDEAARRLLLERGALPYIEAGDIQGAITRAAREWASLPGNNAGQRQLTMADALTLFDDGLRAG